MQHLVTDAQLEILRDIAFFHYLTAEQLQRLRYYASDEPRYAQSRLQQLGALGYIEQVKIRIVSTSAKSPYIWKLTKEALPLLRTIRVTASVPSEETAGQWVFFLHHFLVNDFLIASTLLIKGNPEVRIAKLLHDRELRRTQPYMLIDGKRRQCVPDGFVHFVYQDMPFPVALEVDRDAEQAPQWRLKIRKLLAWAEGPYAAWSGTPVLTIAIVVQGRTEARSQDRLAQLMTWTRQELSLRSKEQLGALFLFSTVTPTSFSAQEYFFTAHWQTPFDAEGRYALIN